MSRSVPSSYPSTFPCQVFAHSVFVPIVAPFAPPLLLANPSAFAPPSLAPAPARHPPLPLPSAAASRVAPMQQALVMQRLQSDAVALEQNRATLIAKSALKLSQDREGCRLVQQALEAAESDEARSALLGTFRGHVWEVTVCPHANHVLQKYVVTMKPAACQFIVDELVKQGPASSCKLARHKYGYRVFQRLLEHLMPQQTSLLIEGLVTDCVALSMHRFGTYVMQHVLEYGSDEQRARVIATLVPQVAKLSMNNDACMVLDAALSKGDEETQDTLVAAVLTSEGAIGAMAHTRRGHVVVLSLLELVAGDLLEQAKQQLGRQAPSLKKNRFGRLVLNFVQLHCGDVVVAATGGA